MTPLYALTIAGGFLALAWLIREFRIAPVIDEPDLGEPYLSAEVRAALNSVEGIPGDQFPVFESGAPSLAPAPSLGDAAPRYAGAGGIFDPFHAAEITDA